MIKKWLADYRQKRLKAKRDWEYMQAKTILAIMVAKKDPEIYAQLKAIAATMAMQFLDKERINHCFLCPSVSQLKKIKNIQGSAYACPNHAAPAAVAENPVTPIPDRKPVPLGVVNAA